MPRTPQLWEDEWFAPQMRGFRQQCCSCGLVHTWDFRIRKGKLEVRISEHKRATAAARRSIKKRVVVLDKTD